MEYLANEMKKYTRSNQDAMKQKMGEINEKKKRIGTSVQTINT